jgi:hypothetical protein
MMLPFPNPTDSLPGREAPAGACATCAFRPGTVANLDQLNRLRVEACLLGGADFMCHEDVRRPCRGYSLASAHRTTTPRGAGLAHLVAVMIQQIEECPEDRERLMADLDALTREVAG